MGVETELKFRLPRKAVAAVGKWKVPGGRVGERSESDLVTTYYDTPGHKLKRHGISLRVRQAGDHHIQTVKAATGAAQFGVGEWEAEIGNDGPDLGKARGTPLERFASKKLARKLKPVFATSVHRITVPVRTRAGEIELAVDCGTIDTPRHSDAVEEVELELKRGQPTELFRIARALERKSAAELTLRSKAERGYDLAQGRPGGAASAEAVALQSEMPVRDAFRVIARSCVRQIAGNADVVRRRDGEGVHQMRVGLRRLRAALSIFADVLTDRRIETVKRELKWLTGELAPAREIDVFLEERIRPAAHELVPRRGAKVIEEEFSARRDNALARAASAVNSDRFRALLVDTLAYIEAGNHHSQRPDGVVADFAADVLKRRIRKIHKQGGQLADISARARHRLRIRVKKVRYALEFFESLFPGKRRQSELADLSKRLKKVQNALGALNDFAAHRKMASEAALHAPPQNRRARAFALGMLLGREDVAAKPLLVAAAEQLDALRPRAISRLAR